MKILKQSSTVRKIIDLYACTKKEHGAQSCDTAILIHSVLHGEKIVNLYNYGTPLVIYSGHPRDSLKYPD
jgi:hypothetical protein